MVGYILLGIFIFFLVIIPLYNIGVWKFSGNRLLESKILYVGHRGAAALAPENTLPAIEYGLAQGVDFIEIDLRQTKDGKLVVMHDKSVNRTTNGSGEVGNLTFDNIRKLNASKSLDYYSAPTYVPLFEEVVKRICSSNASLVIEIKDPQLYPGMVTQLVDIIKYSNCASRLFVFSFDVDIILQIKKVLPQVTTGLFCIGIEKLKYASHVDYICPNWVSLLYFPNLINDIHNKGAKALVWTLDNRLFKQYLIDKNIDGIITNNPSIIK